MENVTTSPANIKQDPDFIDNGSNEVSSDTLIDPMITSVESSDGNSNCFPSENLDFLGKPEEMDLDDIGEFCFETDHLALKSNTDYKRFLCAHMRLLAQREQAIKDLDRLYELKDKALTDPIAFVEAIQRKENLDIPKPQKIQSLPVIEWSKYALSGNMSAFGKRQLSRLSAKSDFFKNVKGKFNKNESEPKAKQNHYWTAEEQRRLEELLVEYPPEEIETRRWEKIANCLENRTPVQVASRVQKYFIRLMKAGIPIPGRMPSTAYMKKPRRSMIRQQPSTFMVSHELPVSMPDDDDFNCSVTQSQNTIKNSNNNEYSTDTKDVSDDESVSADLRNSQEYQELILLKKVLKEKLKSNSSAHLGYKCFRCGADPIIGVRWHCVECKSSSVDFCGDCFECEYYVGQHTFDHRLEAVQQPTGLLDKDYMHFRGSDYNYLDPNYMPAT